MLTLVNGKCSFPGSPGAGPRARKVENFVYCEAVRTPLCFI